MAGSINKLSDKKLKSLLNSDREKEETYADGDGLSVRVSRSGVVSWVFSYRVGGRGSRLERLKLGNYPDMGLKLAREKRDQCRVWLAEAKNPKHQLNITVQENLQPITVRDALVYWVDEYATGHRANVERHKAQLEKHIYPYIGSLPLSLCETHHWLECFDRIKKDSPVAAGYILQMCKQALKFCRVRRYATSNALDDLTIQSVGKKQDVGDREHDDEEIGDIWRSCGERKFKPYNAALLRLLVVFGCRTQEARLSRWDEWDFKKWIWTVPKEHSKGGVKIIRPVPEALRPFIDELHQQHKDSGFLLGVVKESSNVSQWGRGIYKRLGHKTPWTLHDLRRTFSTTLNNLGIAPHVVEQLLGHTMPGVMAVYNKSHYLPEKLEALNIWMERLGVLANKHENVILLKVGK